MMDVVVTILRSQQFLVIRLGRSRLFARPFEEGVVCPPLKLYVRARYSPGSSRRK